ncbi:MAG: FAD synthetase family protein, partial [Dehalococcoidia bacterium]|nr:FAD synthetase family protein [Dehalococcoidia bacterium]
MNLEEKLAQASSESDTALTIGVFDGVHRGHQHLISHLQNAALKNRLLSGIITFDRHPQEIFTPEITLPYLTTKKEREHLLRELKVKLIVTIPFTLQTAQMSARQFVNLLCRYLKMKRFVIGPNTTFGRDKEGNSALLQALGKE